MSHLHIIGAGGIGVSAIGRYYSALGWSVSGSDGAESEITRNLSSEWIPIIIGHDRSNLPLHTDLVVYTEAIMTKPDLTGDRISLISDNSELDEAIKRGIQSLPYPEALAEISNTKRQIAITGSHGKSTTTSMIGIMLSRSTLGGSTIVGTKLTEFWGTNLHFDTTSDIFAIEACEYKEHFLHYTPEIAVITNIDADHLDYYKNAENYMEAFVKFVSRVKRAIVLSGEDPGCRAVYERVAPEIRDRLEWYFVSHDVCETAQGDRIPLPGLDLQVRWDHMRIDANLAYIVGSLLGLSPDERVDALESYQWAWRRGEQVGYTEHGNLVMSDYGHHPSEIQPTLAALRSSIEDKKFVVVFQPHQYSRTRELLPDFADIFGAADILIIPDIYFSRDKAEDVTWMTVDRLIEVIRPYQPNVQNGQGLDATYHILQDLDQESPGGIVFLLLGAGNVDDLRYRLIPSLSLSR